MKDLYKQCEFKSGNLKTTAWIEEKHAKVGLSGKFKDLPEDDTRWEIVSVSDIALPKDEFERRNESFKRMTSLLHK